MTTAQGRLVIVPVERAQKVGLLLTVGALVMETALFLILWGAEPLRALVAGPVDVLWAIAIYFGGVVLHEGIHGLGFWLFGKASLKDIQFGVLWKYLTPYAHLKKPIRARAYRLSLLAPGLGLGLFPLLLGLFLGSPGLSLFGAVFLGAAGGDLAVDWEVRKLPHDVYVLDHPHEIGFFVFEKETP
ncbi:DUF3267 domain-containing protein [Hydrogenibacillus sp. N12]|uniref:DUF3267 domain-containing protein n=1 Tax=Hydrogenibacillus sp. N12 TaxID=2866627 RepID=UPI001C7D264F|nr:DUF3267 domain-containing protein [Hydrogenibacillus sp. N12]QZA33234.1 DUF3267 domain-containing protein [Hydrogenibacillus sp. N12]